MNARQRRKHGRRYLRWTRKPGNFFEGITPWMTSSNRPLVFGALTPRAVALIAGRTP